MDLQEIYKKESGYDVGKCNIDNTNYYSEDYVEWLEKRLRIRGVSNCTLECGNNKNIHDKYHVFEMIIVVDLRMNGSLKNTNYEKKLD